jgi:copper resistance protein C
MAIKQLLLVAAVVAACAPGAPALAHAFLDHSQPAVGSTLAAPPAQVRIWFTEALEPAFSTIAVTDAQGHEMGQGKAKVDTADHQLLVLDLVPLAPGTYHVVWRVVSVDSHPTNGRFDFTVGK